MVWTAPSTYTTGQVPTAAGFNIDIRDNLLETEPAKVTAAGDILYGAAANSLTRRAIGTSGSLLHVSSANVPDWLAPSTASGDVLMVSSGMPAWRAGPGVIQRSVNGTSYDHTTGFISLLYSVVPAAYLVGSGRRLRTIAVGEYIRGSTAVLTWQFGLGNAVPDNNLTIINDTGAVTSTLARAWAIVWDADAQVSATEVRHTIQLFMGEPGSAGAPPTGTTSLYAGAPTVSRAISAGTATNFQFSINVNATDGIAGGATATFVTMHFAVTELL